MPLCEIDPSVHDIVIALAYATPENVTGRPIYRHARCYLHADAQAAAAPWRADAGRCPRLPPEDLRRLRPPEAQWVLWNHTPDPEFVADPRRGSPHSRGVAVDLT